MAEVNCIDQLREENQHLRKLLEHISLSDQGGEIFPSGPSEYVYADDGNTLIDVKGPWCFCGGRGSTFIEAVDGSMKKDGAKEMPQPSMVEVKND